LRILDRYIFGSVFGTTFGAVSLLASVLVAGNMLKDLLALAAAGQLPGLATFKLIVLVLPIVVSYALPLGFLAGVLMSFGRMSADLEITAMKCAGLSVWRIGAPVLAVGLLGTFIAGLSNCYLGPQARSAYRDTVEELLRKDPTSFLEKRVAVKFTGFVLYVGELDGEKLGDFWVWELDSEGRARRLLRSRTGTFRFDVEKSALILTLQNAFVEARGKGLSGVSPAPSPAPLPAPGNATARPSDESGNLAEFQKIELELPLEGLFGGSAGTMAKRNTLTQDELGKRIDEGRAELEKVPLDRKTERKALADDISKNAVRWHRNLAMAFSVLPMGLLALPLSFKTGRRETYVNAGLALGLGLIYYLLISVFEALQGKPQLHPEWLIWLPNVIFLSIGMRLMRRAAQH
jgi:lipopolysaccharide export system permease protein